jgi:hypothetical protein
LDITTAYTERTGVQYGIVRVGYLFGESHQHPPAERITFDRCDIHGTPTGNIRDGMVVYNVKHCAVTNCRLWDFHGVGYESHALHLYSPPGPVKVANNYIEAAGINLFIGDGKIPEGTMPEDIEIVGNDLYKPWSWKEGHPEYAGIRWTIKNLLEIKAARRVLIEDNLMGNTWVGGQHGQVILLTPRGGAVEDVTIRNNVFRHFEGCMNLNSANVQLDRVLVENNLAYAPLRRTVMFYLAGTPGRVNDITIRKNTMLAEPGFPSEMSNLLFFNGRQDDEINGLVCQDNLAAGRYGISGNGTSPGKASLDRYCSTYNVEHNAFIGGHPSWYPEGESLGPHYFPRSVAECGFTNLRFSEIEDFRLSPSSPYIRASSAGAPLGCDIDQLPDTGGSNMPKAIAEWTPGAQWVQSQKIEWLRGEEVVATAALAGTDMSRDSDLDNVEMDPGERVTARITSANPDGESGPVGATGTVPFPSPDPPTSVTIRFEE